MTEVFITTRRVRFGDCDPGGVLYTPNISFYVVESIRAFMDEVLEAPMEKAIIDMGVFPPAKAFSVEFISFLKWDDEIDIHVRIKHVGTSSFAFSVLGFCEGNPVFSAELTQVCVDPDSKKSTPIPGDLKDILLQYLNDE